MRRRNVGQQFDGDSAVFQLHQDGVFGVFDLGHAFIPFADI